MTIIIGDGMQLPEWIIGETRDAPVGIGGGLQQVDRLGSIRGSRVGDSGW